jgi:hypothetical protein
VTDLDINCISVRYDEDCNIEERDILMMGFPSLSGLCMEFVGSNPCFELIVGKCSNEATERVGHNEKK